MLGQGYILLNRLMSFKKAMTLAVGTLVKRTVVSNVNHGQSKMPKFKAVC